MHTAVQLIDVRAAGEYCGHLVNIGEAQLVPLEQRAEHAARLSHDIPVVTVCRRGARSA
jgi:rhodanese-related sulfurtransferase